MKIGELLIEQKLITTEQLEQALAAQQTFGGKLGTNLIEHGFISDVELSLFLSKQLNMPAATHADFENIPPEILELISKELAEQYKVVPIRMEKKHLVVAISDVNDLNSLDELKFKTGKTVTPIVAPEIWLVAALERYYQVPREERYIAIEGEQLEARIASSEPSVRGENAISLQGYVERLLKTVTKEDVFGALLDFLAPFSPQEALFMLRKDRIFGAMLHGFPVRLSQFQKVEIPMETSAVFKPVFETQKPYYGRLSDQIEDHKLIEMLHLAPQRMLGIWPILFRSKAVAVILMTFETNNPGDVQSREELFKIAIAKAGYALELGALRKVISELP